MAKPIGGYVGLLRVSPEHGPAGTPLTVTGDGFPAGEEFQLVWRTVKGRWKVTIPEYHGREYTPVAYRIATVKSDRDGRLEHSDELPERHVRVQGRRDGWGRHRAHVGAVQAVAVAADRGRR